jgi:hypothetical protein
MAPAHDSAAVDRDAKIEQLLLVGLDHYFAAQYQQAINVWTRALFLDRTHARARAYIERARSAMAERQRQSEELLQHGVDAFRRGEGDEARRLLTAAIDGGAPSEEALAVLGRLDRLEPTASLQQPPKNERTRPSVQTASPRTGVSTLGLMAIALLVIVGLAAVGYAVLVSERVDWNAVWPSASANTAAKTPPSIARETALPLPRRGDAAVARARALAAGGRLHDALSALDDVRPTDPRRPDADRLRADLQRQLLAVTRLP